MEDSWPYFKRALAYSGPVGVPFYTRDEALKIYNKAARCLRCKSAADLSCLRQKSLDELNECTWSLRAIATNDGPANISLKNRKVTQLAEMYGPIIGTKVLKEDIYQLIKSGSVKPDVELVINYASDEGEDFIESIFYPFGSEDQKVQNRVSRVPRKLMQKLFQTLYDRDNTTVTSDKLINQYSNCTTSEINSPDRLVFYDFE